jgi:hypothetical protein
MSVIEIRSATGSLLMLIARLLLSTVVVSCLQAAAAACEHCRAAAMAALRITAPSGSAQSQRQQRLQEFLRNGVAQ